AFASPNASDDRSNFWQRRSAFAHKENRVSPCTRSPGKWRPGCRSTARFGASDNISTCSTRMFALILLSTAAPKRTASRKGFSASSAHLLLVESGHARDTILIDMLSAQEGALQ